MKPNPKDKIKVIESWAWTIFLTHKDVIFTYISFSKYFFQKLLGSLDLYRLKKKTKPVFIVVIAAAAVGSTDNCYHQLV